MTNTQLTQVNAAVDQRIKNDILFIGDPIRNADKLGGTERAIISFFALVLGLSLFKATKKYAIYGGVVVLLLWSDKLYKQFSGASK